MSEEASGRVRVEVEVRPTEDPQKVLQALRNVFPSLVFSRSENVLRGEGSLLDLERFRELLKRQAIRDAAKSHLLAKCREGRIEFMLNKQVAYCGKVNFTDGESPLGPISVVIETSNPVGLVRHLTER